MGIEIHQTNHLWLSRFCARPDGVPFAQFTKFVMQEDAQNSNSASAVFADTVTSKGRNADTRAASNIVLSSYILLSWSAGTGLAGYRELCTTVCLYTQKRPASVHSKSVL